MQQEHQGMDLNLLLADPEAQCIRTPNAFWAVFGIGPRLPDGFEQRLTRDDTTAQKLCTDLGDAAALKIELDAGRAVQVTIWKGISSGYEIFYSVRSNGDVLVGAQEVDSAR